MGLEGEGEKTKAFIPRLTPPTTATMNRKESPSHRATSSAPRSPSPPMARSYVFTEAAHSSRTPHSLNSVIIYSPCQTRR